MLPVGVHRPVEGSKISALATICPPKVRLLAPPETSPRAGHASRGRPPVPPRVVQGRVAASDAGAVVAPRDEDLAVRKAHGDVVPAVRVLGHSRPGSGPGVVHLVHGSVAGSQELAPD